MPPYASNAPHPQLSFATAASAKDAACHTLVCVFLRGGADTLNFWVPYADDHYYRQRPNLAIPPPGTARDAAIRLTETYALHPALRPLEAAFKEGRLGVVQAVGHDNTSGSHFECQDQMEHGDSAEGPEAGGGWLGRFLRLKQLQRSPLSAVAIGTALPESLRGAPSASVMERLTDIALRAPTGNAQVLENALDVLYARDTSLLGQFGKQTLSLFQRVAALKASPYLPENGATYGSDDFSVGLSEIARLIKARVGLEVACLDLGGWDTHFFQGASTGLQASRLTALGTGLAAFENDLREHRSTYTVILTTEFGRRLYENASLGTDHGRGFAFAALGDKVQGGRILGSWPVQPTEEDNPLGPAGLLPTVDYRSVFAEVLRSCHGVNQEEMAQVFPGALLTPVGLMA